MKGREVMKITLRLGIGLLVLLASHTYFNTALSQEQYCNNQQHIAQTADLVIFSFDRPLQLYALLESVEKYVTGLNSIQVIYRASDVQFSDAYKHVHERFSAASFIAQGDRPRADFKPLTVQALTQSSSPYVLFAVDDIIVTDAIDCTACINALEKYNAYGFYLRLGRNLTECYSMNSSQRLPLFAEREPGLLEWRFVTGEHDWRYPNTVDMTLYRKKDIEMLFKQMQYWAPNPLEATWAGRAHSVMNNSGLCYAHTKIVNVPLNSVQLDFTNRNMEFMTSKQLLDLFNQGKKIDISLLYHIDNKSAHMAYIPTFLERT